MRKLTFRKDIGPDKSRLTIFHVRIHQDFGCNAQLKHQFKGKSTTRSGRNTTTPMLLPPIGDQPAIELPGGQLFGEPNISNHPHMVQD